MNRVARSSFSLSVVILVVGLGTGCGGDVGTPVASTGPGGGAAGAGAKGGGAGAGSNATAGVGGSIANGGTGGTGGSAATGGSSAQGGTGGDAGKGGTAGTGGGAGSGPTCEAATPVPDVCDCDPGPNAGPAGYYWDGSVCAELFGCCPQVQNGTLYPTQASCKADHEGCGSCGATTLGVDPCDCDPGKKVFYWDGQSCAQALVCCPMGGGKLYDSEEACQKAHDGCGQGLACDGDGDCPALPCAPCPGGGGSCPVATCTGGKCVYAGGGTCPPPTCDEQCANGCGYTDKRCGTGNASPSCLPTPKCASEYEPVCGCDGTVHANSCLAATAGVDLSVLGNCTPPTGYFACGDRFCTKGQQYCRRLGSDVGNFADQYECLALPAACASPGGGGGPCSCFEKEPCGSVCQPDAEGYITLTCFGG